MSQTENPNKVDMTKTRTKEEWQALLDCVKRNDSGTLTGIEQSYYVNEITYKITGKRHSKDEVLKAIEDGAADIKDLVS